MRDPIVFDDGVRLTETIRIRVPPDFRQRMQAASAAEGIAPTEFARRAIAERFTRNSHGQTGYAPVPAEGEPPPDAASPATTPAAAEAVTAPVVAPRAPPSQATAAEAPARPASPRSRSAWTQP